MKSGWENSPGTWGWTLGTTAHGSHLLETKGIQGVIGYRRHTHEDEHYGKYRFKYDPTFDTYFCPEGKRLYWKTTTREGYRQYFSNRKDCAGCPRRAACFSEKATRRMATRHVWQDALDEQAQQVVVYREGTPVGTARLWWYDGGFYTGDFCVLPKARFQPIP